MDLLVLHRRFIGHKVVDNKSQIDTLSGIYIKSTLLIANLFVKSLVLNKTT